MTSQTPSTSNKDKVGKTYTLPEALKPVTKMLEEADVPIVYGPNPIPAPVTLSDQAKLAWSQIPQVPSPVKDAVQFAAVREFTFSLEKMDFDRFQEPYSLIDKTINGVTVMWVTPPELKYEDKVLIFIHGGGYVVNSRKTQLAFQAATASKLGVKVASIEYPLAPEHPYPAAMNAILDAYQGICDLYGADNIGLFGTSAGGGVGAGDVVAPQTGRSPASRGKRLPVAGGRHDAQW